MGMHLQTMQGVSEHACSPPHAHFSEAWGAMGPAMGPEEAARAAKKALAALQLPDLVSRLCGFIVVTRSHDAASGACSAAQRAGRGASGACGGLQRARLLEHIGNAP